MILLLSHIEFSHCRFCGKVFCQNCSSKLLRDSNTLDELRCCDWCFEAAITAKSRQEPSHPTSNDRLSNYSSSNEQLLYTTKSLCVRCSLLERKTFKLRFATVRRQGNSIMLHMNCPDHGSVTTLLSKDAYFFTRMMQFVEKPLPQTESDIEDLEKTLDLTPKSSNLPLILELSLFHNGTFASESSIDSQFRVFQRLYPSDVNFIVNLKSSVLPMRAHVVQFNRMVLRIEALVKQCILLLDLTFERLIDLARLPGSSLLKGRVFPCVRYFVEPGQEQICIGELSKVVDDLSDFSCIEMMLVICFKETIPDFRSIIEFTSRNRQVIKLLVFSPERSPRALLSQFNNPRQSTNCDQSASVAREMSKAVITTEAIDPAEVIAKIVNESGGRFVANDFVPMSISRVFEPLLASLGSGNAFRIRPSPFCAFATCLVNSSTMKGVPLPRLFDLLKFYQAMKPLMGEFTSTGAFAQLALLKKLRKIIDSCKLNQQIPDLTTYLTDSSKVDKLLAGLQFIIVHNTMDFASIDLTRRCQCPLLASSSIASNGLVASCTGCI